MIRRRREPCPSKPGPKGPRKTATVRDRVLLLRARDHSVTEIAARLSAEGSPVSAQTVWAILHAEGIERLARRGPGGPAPRTDPVKARPIRSGRRGRRGRATTPGSTCCSPPWPSSAWTP
jgi:hypothetical protein